ncbi:MAG: DUF4271 domain-containing protein [Lewinellaceae bacterium]|nr:DUF4271 domain-containing protein [Lewinellaceae bacterium]
MKGKTIPRWAWFGLLLLLAAVQGLFAQGGQNPFELKPRLPKDTITASQAPVDSVPSNPFEIVAPPAPGETPATTDSYEEGAPGGIIVSSTEEGRYRRFLFTTVIELFLFLTILFTLFRSIPIRVYRAFLNDNILSQLHREQGSIVSIPYFLFYLFFFFNAGFFLFLLTRYYGITIAQRNWISFLLLTGGLMALFAGKHLLLKILEAVLPFSKEFRLYSFTIIVFSIAIGILLIPFNLLIAYGPVDAVSGVVVLSMVMLGFVFAFRFIRGIFIAGRLVALHLFHFLLYICTVEIAPVLIIAKMIYSTVATQ